ncbi:MAG: FAD-binding protein [Desulfofustis sp.]|nr:FAD-binding protein [Desulfofustis sp.]NNK56144.1 FAD-binding protein [Desulfofustis sp.]
MTAIPSRLIPLISDIVGSDNLTSRIEDLHCYSYDGTARPHLPGLIVFPRNAEQISKIMKLASTHRIPVVPRGAGTGMTGGIVPVAGGIVMALTKLDAIVEIDTDNQIGIVEPGVITGEFQAAVRKKGLFYPVDPASLKYCSIGGNAAECAGGPSAVKYGVTKDYIIGLEVVLANGDIITTGARTEKSVTGYDLTRLFVGSEGTLGIITKLIVRLLPIPPHKQTFLLTSTSLRRTTQMVSEILNHNIQPCTLEYMDKTAIDAVSSFMENPPPETAQALLIVEIDGEKANVTKQAAKFISLVSDRSEFTLREATTQVEVEQIWQARRAISPSVLKLRPHKIGEDVAVPRSRIPELVEYTEKLSEELGLMILTFGHAGDGNIHVNIMLDRSNGAEVERAEEAKERLFRQAISLGGTLSGEHGIGLSKKPFMRYELNEATLELMKKIKTMFDPNHILNPGKIFPA